MPLPKTCEQLVPSSHDAPPIRSPQVVHSFIASRIAGKDLVEIGTRNGDGMSCFALHARRATAIEYAKEYCVSLEQRSKTIEASHPGMGYKVTCADYRTGGVLDADIITWWEQSPLENLPALSHARRQQALGKVRANAQAILLFDPKWPDDVKGWDALCPLASWSARIPFDERAKCLSDNGGASPEGPATCDRAFGHFIVAGIPIARVGRALENQLKVYTDKQRAKCQERHRNGWRTATGTWQLYEQEAKSGHHGHGSGSGHKEGILNAMLGRRRLFAPEGDEEGAALLTDGLVLPNEPVPVPAPLPVGEAVGEGVGGRGLVAVTRLGGAADVLSHDHGVVLSAACGGLVLLGLVAGLALVKVHKTRSRGKDEAESVQQAVIPSRGGDAETRAAA